MLGEVLNLSSAGCWLMPQLYSYLSKETFATCNTSAALWTGLSGQTLTCGETCLLVTLGELDMEVGDQCVDVVVPLDLQAERCGEWQVLTLHRVDVHLLCGSLHGTLYKFCRSYSSSSFTWFHFVYFIHLGNHLLRNSFLIALNPASYVENCSAA